jgi:hypothetical protein
MCSILDIAVSLKSAAIKVPASLGPRRRSATGDECGAPVPIASFGEEAALRHVEILTANIGTAASASGSNRGPFTTPLSPYQMTARSAWSKATSATDRGCRQPDRLSPRCTPQSPESSTLGRGKLPRAWMRAKIVPQ